MERCIPRYTNSQYLLINLDHVLVVWSQYIALQNPRQFLIVQVPPRFASVSNLRPLSPFSHVCSRHKTDKLIVQNPATLND